MSRSSVQVPARTPEAVRRAIRESNESVRTLASRYNVNPKTVQKWKHRTDLVDRTATRRPAHKLGPIAEDIIAGFRLTTKLPLDDCLYALQEVFPELTRSSLHRFLKKRGLSKLPDDHDGADHVPGSKLGHFETLCIPARAGDEPYIGLIACDREARIFFGFNFAVDDRDALARFPQALAAFLPFEVKSLGSPLFEFTEPPVRYTRQGDQFLTENGAAWASQFDAICKAVFGDSSPEAFFGPRSSTATFRDLVHAKEEMSSYNLSYNCGRRFKSIGGLKPCDYLERLWSHQPELFHSRPRSHFENLVHACGKTFDQIAHRSLDWGC